MKEYIANTQFVEFTKESIPINPVQDTIENVLIYKCHVCEEYHIFEGDNYCSNCGRRINWGNKK